MTDKMVFFEKIENECMIILVVVDAMMYVTNFCSFLEDLKEHLSKTFDVTVFGELKSFIGWEIERSNRVIKDSQPRYTLLKNILKELNMENCNASWTRLHQPTNFFQQLMKKR